MVEIIEAVCANAFALAGLILATGISIGVVLNTAAMIAEVYWQRKKE